MKRIITAALVLAMLTALLAGCGGSKGKTVEDIKKAGKLVGYIDMQAVTLL